ncbi:hypothetical protein [Rubrobacter marinus]|uniref:hypothetical protein n=1 Tax=Rubrobacter marinus TaxID=2653852 RepID=UPI001409622B|nr:hypothetical protein [Rubrobacter marinus]
MDYSSPYLVFLLAALVFSVSMLVALFVYESPPRASTGDYAAPGHEGSSAE